MLLGGRVGNPFDEGFGSAVMPTAKAVYHPDWLLDELELRLTRCVPTLSPTLRTGTVLPAGESLHRIAEGETRGWWSEMGLVDADALTRRRIFEAMLARSPMYLGWAAVPLVSEYLHDLRSTEALLRLVRWVTSHVAVHRVVRDAIALSVVVPWLLEEEPDVVKDVILAWGLSDDLSEIRMGLMVAAAFVRDADEAVPVLERAILDVCWANAGRVDSETAVAVGWAMKQLIRRAPRRVLPEMLARVREMSRQAMRTAVEGLAVETRRQLTSQWRGRVRERPWGVTQAPSSHARTKN